MCHTLSTPLLCPQVARTGRVVTLAAPQVGAARLAEVTCPSPNHGAGHLKAWIKQRLLGAGFEQVEPTTVVAPLPGTLPLPPERGTQIKEIKRKLPCIN